jgi:hypothetical protein
MRESWHRAELVRNIGLRNCPAGDHHHIFVDIHDKRGVNSRYLDPEVNLADTSAYAEAASALERQRAC